MQYFYSATANGFYLDVVHSTMPSDVQPITLTLYQSLLGKSVVPGADGQPAIYQPSAPTIADIAASMERFVQSHIDAQAQAMGYDDIATAVTYADEPAVPKFQAEGQALRAWRSLVWARCYELLAEVQAGSREAPTESGLIALLPVFNLPPP